MNSVGWGWFWPTRLQFKSGREVINNNFYYLLHTKNTDFDQMNSPLGPKSKLPLLSTIRKRWRLEGRPLVRLTVWKQHHNIRVVVCATAVGFGLWRSKPQRRWAIAGHRSMATGVREKVEAAEGLYLSCRPRYSRRKMGVDVHSSWSISEKIMVEGDGCARCFLCLSLL